MEYAKINVLIVTYNQADVIGRNIESIIRQKDYGLNEIVIADDCSKDNNWAVIQEYVNKYPHYIRAYRNEPNLGIYGNSNKLIKERGNADLYCWLEGDDALVDGLFADVQKQIRESKINLDEATGLFHDYMVVGPNGDEKRVSNRNILLKKKPISLYIRGMVSWRASLFTEGVMAQFVEADITRGVGTAESMFDSQFFKYLRKVYYSPIPGSIYYSGVGVSTDIGSHSSYYTTEVIENAGLLTNFWHLDKRDTLWMQYCVYRAQYLMNSSFITLMKTIFYYVRGSRGYNFNLHFVLHLVKEHFVYNTTK